MADEKTPPVSRRLLAGVAGSIDRLALRAMEQLFLAGRRKTFDRLSDIHDRIEQLERTAAFYGRPEHFREPDSFFVPPADIVVEERRVRRLPPDGEIVDLAWVSEFVATLPSYRERYAAYAGNGRAHARVYRHPHPAPAIVCLHGWAGGHFAIDERAWFARSLYRAGLDVALLVLPFHGPRAPGGRMSSGRLFPSLSIVRTNEGFAHAVHDARALVRHLRARGAPRVGVAGMSLGGYTTALLATLDALDFAVPMIPVASIADLMWQHGEGRPERARAEQAGVTLERLREVWRVHSPLARPPRVPASRTLIIAGTGDRITPLAQAERLREHFGGPELALFPGGHIAQFRRAEAFRALRAFLARAID